MKSWYNIKHVWIKIYKKRVDSILNYAHLKDIKQRTVSELQASWVEYIVYRGRFKKATNVRTNFFMQLKLLFTLYY